MDPSTGPSSAAGKRESAGRTAMDKEAALTPGGDETAQRFAPAADVPQTEGATTEVKELQQEAATVSVARAGRGVGFLFFARAARFGAPLSPTRRRLPPLAPAAPPSCEAHQPQPRRVPHRF